MQTKRVRNALLSCGEDIHADGTTQSARDKAEIWEGKLSRY